MGTNRRGATRVVTPRRRKAWAVTTFAAKDISASAGDKIVDDLLSAALTQEGVTLANGITVMRLIYDLRLAGNTADQSGDTIADYRFGFCWVRADVASASAGDAQIPKPLGAGFRDIRWYHQFRLDGIRLNGTTGVNQVPLEPIELSHAEADVSNMQKQPGIQYKFVLIASGGANIDTSAVDLVGHVQIMYALP